MKRPNIILSLHVGQMTIVDHDIARGEIDLVADLGEVVAIFFVDSFENGLEAESVSSSRSFEVLVLVFLSFLLVVVWALVLVVLGKLLLVFC